MRNARTLVIGDIHSGLRALEQLLDKALVTENDTLIFLGDYVDGWSTAVETVNYLIALQETHKCILLRGNHDELCYDWLKEGKDNPIWFQHGGEATMKSYSEVSSDTIQKHFHFYENLKNYHLDEQDRLYLHAGFTNLKGVEHEYFSKTFYWDRTLWELARSINPELAEDDLNYPSRLSHYKEIYIGHTPISKTLSDVVPLNAANVWNIDTGAAFKGPITILDVETKEFWQSEPVQTFYPQERGRN